MDLIQDAYRFILYFRHGIEDAPLQVYTSALLFAPACSSIKKCFESEFPEWITTKPAVDPNWNSCIQVLEGHEREVTSVVYSPDGQWLASASYDGSIKIWDAASGNHIRTLQDKELDAKTIIAFSPNSQQLASGSEHGIIEIWNMASYSCIQKLDGHSGWVKSISFSPNGQRLVSGSNDWTIKI